MIDVSVIVPALSTDLRVKECVSRLSCLPENYEVIVATEKGKGKAIVEATRRAKGNIIVTCDTDFTSQSLIPVFVKQFTDSHSDMMIGKRFIPHNPLSRRVYSSLYNFFKQFLFGSLPDTQSGFKIFHKQTLLRFADNFKISGLAWDTEFVVKAKETNLKIVETNILERRTEGTTRFVHGFGMIKDLTKVWLTNKFNLALLFVSLTYLIALICASTFTSIPIGTDVHFHYKVASYYANFQNGMFSPTVLELNQFPYPPLFHLILVPSIWFNVQYLFAKLLQIALPFLIYISTITFIRYYTNQKTQLTTALLLLSTMGFIDGTIQARPQGLTMILIPLTLFAYIQRKDNKYTLVSGAIAYTHGIAGIANTWTLTLYGFVRGHWNRTFIKQAIFLAPILLMTFIYLGGAVGKWGGSMDTYQEYLIFTKPQEMIPYYSGMCLIGWVFLAQNLTRWSNASMLEKTLSLSLIGLTIMIPFWADRFLQYATITLACLAALGLNKYKRAHNILLIPITVMYILVMVNMFWVTATNNWWLYPQ